MTLPYVSAMSLALRRCGLFLVGYFVILVVAALAKAAVPRALADLAWGSLASCGLAALTWAFLRIEHRRAEDIGVRASAASPARLTAGLAIGVATYACALLLISVGLGPLTWSAPAWPSPGHGLLVVASFLMLSCMEELGFRAYMLRTLSSALGVWPAQALVAVAFGLTHVAYGWPLRTVVMGVIPSALLFGAAAWRSQGLALPIGVHAGVNLAQWLVGEKESAGVWTLSAAPEHTARLASGAPWVATAVTLLTATVVWTWPARRATAD